MSRLRQITGVGVSQELFCKGCGKTMGVLRDAKVRVGMVVYCMVCDSGIQDALAQARNRKTEEAVMPDFLKDMFGGYRR